MILRGLLFAAWALLGAMLSYGVIYLVSPVGFAIVTAALVAYTLVGRARCARVS